MRGQSDLTCLTCPHVEVTLENYLLEDGEKKVKVLPLWIITEHV